MFSEACEERIGTDYKALILKSPFINVDIQEVTKECSYGEVLVDTRKDTLSLVMLGQHVEAETVFEMIAPKDTPVNTKIPTEEQRAVGEIKFAQAAVKRKDKTMRFYKEKEADELKRKYGYSMCVLEFLKESMGNFDEIVKFLDNTVRTKAREEMLKSLTIKDFRDWKSKTWVYF